MTVLNNYLDINPGPNFSIKADQICLYLRLDGLLRYEYLIVSPGKFAPLEELKKFISTLFNYVQLFQLHQGDLVLILPQNEYAKSKLNSSIKELRLLVEQNLEGTSVLFSVYQTKSKEEIYAFQAIAACQRSLVHLLTSERVEFTNIDDLENLEAELHIMNSIPKAIFMRHITFHYQPIVDLHSQKVLSVEALARWNDGETSYSPMSFIPLVQNSPFKEKFDNYLIDSVLSEYASLVLKFGPIEVSMNFMSESLMSGVLINRLIDSCHKYNVPTDKIIIEISELEPIRVDATLINNLNRLRSHGFKISLDDFTQGYSCLSALSHLPIDQIKVDRMLTSKILTSNKSLNIFSLIALICVSLKIDVIVEGVETFEQSRKLIDLGFTSGQGYLYSKPMSLWDLCSDSKYKGTRNNNEQSIYWLDA
ncbi:EAL domain-containing protein [Planctobacterium marinum]|uniref:EAL domain-containing protein n=1 Tax=Planctobacterium marinum TaxID=1631968 RepID=UPI001E2EABE4|nr:EAL domain-containing protein [Planctobacterium marinum]MCC2605737.1 EAL domain-containing protein [Planctobacterium marinum]